MSTFQSEGSPPLRGKPSLQFHIHEDTDGSQDTVNSARQLSVVSLSSSNLLDVTDPNPSERAPSVALHLATAQLH